MLESSKLVFQYLNPTWTRRLLVALGLHLSVIQALLVLIGILHYVGTLVDVGIVVGVGVLVHLEFYRH